MKTLFLAGLLIAVTGTASASELLPLKGTALIIDDERTEITVIDELAQKLYESIPNQRHNAMTFKEKTTEIVPGFTITSRVKNHLDCKMVVIDASLRGQYNVGTRYECKVTLFHNWAKFMNIDHPEL